jgi:hypothetical protein
MTFIRAMVQWRTNAASHLVEVRGEDDHTPVKDTAECGATIPYGEVWESPDWGPTCRPCRRIARRKGLPVEYWEGVE